MTTAAADPAPSDRDLLRAFADRDDEAFTEIVRRHGPLVLAVCRRVLADRPEADDAFQATFLVLARKAAAVRRPEQLANYLYGVALRCSWRVKAAAAAHRARQLPMSDVPAPPAPATDWADIRLVLDAEVERLPGKLRTALVLCELQELDRPAAAARLGVPLGTVSSRLARAKELLRRRLLRRGMALSAFGLGLVLAEATARAAVPPDLAAETAAAAVRFAAGAGTVPGSAAVIAHKELAVMVWKKVLVGGLLATGLLGVVGVGEWAELPRAGAAAVAALDDKKADKAAIQGTWKIVSAKKSGRKAGDDGPEYEGETVTITADKLKFHVEGEYKLDPAKDPKQIDITALGGAPSEIGKLFPGIYKLDGDKLVIRFAPPGQDRPKTLESKPGSQAILLELERVKK